MPFKLTWTFELDRHVLLIRSLTNGKLHEIGHITRTHLDPVSYVAETIWREVVYIGEDISEAKAAIEKSLYAFIDDATKIVR